MWNKIKENGIVLAVIVLSVAAVILFQLFGVKSIPDIVQTASTTNKEK